MFLSQRKYASKILKQAHMVGCNSSQTPIDTESKLEQQVCLHMHNPREPHFSALKRILSNLLTWSSKCQPTLSLSSAEAEYCGVTNSVAETLEMVEMVGIAMVGTMDVLTRHSWLVIYETMMGKVVR
nr:ribonuclease H-like domain-containing protein [Tanacetum cinerariifolium]